MIIRIIAVGNKMPSWVESGVNEYTKRLRPYCQFQLLEITPERRLNNSDIERIKVREGEKILAQVKSHHHLIALEVTGESWSTEDLASEIEQWQSEAKPVDLIIGGPDGLSDDCLKKAHQRWSLSALTFPHPLVRIILTEQLYRAFSILQNHPYHR